MIFCTSCGSQSNTNSKYCSKCGAEHISNLYSMQENTAAQDLSSKDLNFLGNFVIQWKKTLVTDGRISSREFWWLQAAILLVSLFALLLLEFSPEFLQSFSLSLFATLNSVLTVLSLSSSIRRLHDVNKSGWWLLLVLTVFGLFYILYLLIKKGNEGINKYGSAPVIKQPEKLNLSISIFAIIYLVINNWSITNPEGFKEKIDSLFSSSESQAISNDGSVNSDSYSNQTIDSSIESSGSNISSESFDAALKIAKIYDSAYPEDDMCYGYLEALVRGEPTGSGQNMCDVPQELQAFLK